MSSKLQRIIGWVVTGLITAMLLMSGVTKFLDFPGKDEAMAKIGVPVNLLPKLGVLEICITLLYVIPRTSFLGAILITGYLGGAIMTHLRIGEPWQIQLMVGVVTWIGLALRRPILFKLLVSDRDAVLVEETKLQ